MKYLLSLILVATMTCIDIGNNIKRCENEEVICYVYDSGWAGFAKSGRGAGISCKFKEQEQ